MLFMVHFLCSFSQDTSYNTSAALPLGLLAILKENIRHTFLGSSKPFRHYFNVASTKVLYITLDKPLILAQTKFYITYNIDAEIVLVSSLP